MPACNVFWDEGTGNRPPVPDELKGTKLPRNGKITNNATANNLLAPAPRLIFIHKSGIGNFR